MSFQRAIRFAVLALGVAVLLVQLVPYGRSHANPPVTQEPNWDSPRTQELAARACLDCHSNETKWPWYSNVAPVSWRIQNHVDEGRATLNLSRMDRPQEEAHEAAEAVSSGEMPPKDYLLAHPEEVDAVLARSAQRARAVARETVDRCKRACGLL